MLSLLGVYNFFGYGWSIYLGLLLVESHLDSYVGFLFLLNVLFLLIIKKGSGFILTIYFWDKFFPIFKSYYRFFLNKTKDFNLLYKSKRILDYLKFKYNIKLVHKLKIILFKKIYFKSFEYQLGGFNIQL